MDGRGNAFDDLRDYCPDDDDSANAFVGEKNRRCAKRAICHVQGAHRHGEAQITANLFYAMIHIAVERVVQQRLRKRSDEQTNVGNAGKR